MMISMMITTSINNWMCVVVMRVNRRTWVSIQTASRVPSHTWIHLAIVCHPLSGKSDGIAPSSRNYNSWVSRGDLTPKNTCQLLTEQTWLAFLDSRSFRSRLGIRSVSPETNSSPNCFSWRNTLFSSENMGGVFGIKLTVFLLSHLLLNDVKLRWDHSLIDVQNRRMKWKKQVIAIFHSLICKR